MINENCTLNNRLWVHYGDTKECLHTVAIKRIDWRKDNDRCTVILEGFLLKDRFLLDIWDKNATFEVITGTCGDSTDYEYGQRLMLMENLKSFAWWTQDVTSCEENSITRLYCEFTCDWIEICES